MKMNSIYVIECTILLSKDECKRVIKIGTSNNIINTMKKYNFAKCLFQKEIENASYILQKIRRICNTKYQKIGKFYEYQAFNIIKSIEEIKYVECKHCMKKFTEKGLKKHKCQVKELQELIEKHNIDNIINGRFNELSPIY